MSPKTVEIDPDFFSKRSVEEMNAAQDAKFTDPKNQDLKQTRSQNNIQISISKNQVPKKRSNKI